MDRGGVPTPGPPSPQRVERGSQPHTHRHTRTPTGSRTGSQRPSSKQRAPHQGLALGGGGGQRPPHSPPLPPAIGNRDQNKKEGKEGKERGGETAKQSKESQEGHEEGGRPERRRRKSRQARFWLCPDSSPGLGCAPAWQSQLQVFAQAVLSTSSTLPPSLPLLLDLQNTTQLMSPPGSLP